MALVIINSISIGVQGGLSLSLSFSLSMLNVFPAELPVSDSVGLMVLKEVLEFVDMFTVVAFSIEIGLKWVDSYKNFWKNGWNVFDLIVTVLVRMISNVK